jgi:hypothetical protein
MNTFIFTTPEELRSIVHQAVADALKQEKTPPPPERMPVQKLVEYMTERGYITTAATIYNYVYKNKIPFDKVNRKLIFERKQIDVWLTKQLRK